MPNENGIPEYSDVGETEEPIENNSEESGSEPETPGVDGGDDGLDALRSKWKSGDSPSSDVEGEQSSISKLRDALSQTKPHEPLENIESPYDPENGGIPRVYRGIKKMTGVEGTPAWLDISLGLIEMVEQEAFALPGSSADSSNNQAGAKPSRADDAPGEYV